MKPFKGRHFQRDIILWAVRWYCKYGISYPELQEMLAERGVNGDHSTISRWIQRYAPDIEHRQIKYRNNVIECDHGKLKSVIGATLGFKSMKTLRHTQPPHFIMGIPWARCIW